MSSYNFNHIDIDRQSDVENIHSGDESFWQSSLWAQILTKTGQAEVILAQDEDNSILIERRKIWWKYSGLYILGVNSLTITDDFIASVKEKVVSEYDLFLQIEPIGSWKTINEKLSTKNYHTAPFRRFIEPVTALLDLQTTEEILLASFAEKGRYNIRLAEKRGVTTRWVVASEACNEKWHWFLLHEKTYLKCFYDLLDETTKRDGFAHNSLEYYRHFVETLEANNAGGLLIAEKDGELHAAGIFAYCGDTAIYYYGASSSNPQIRRDMATYLLQWGAIREAMKRKCSTYDFLGISADGKGKLAGVTDFKLRFNPEKKQWPHEYVIVYKPFFLLLLRGISILRKFFR